MKREFHEIVTARFQRVVVGLFLLVAVLNFRPTTSAQTVLIDPIPGSIEPSGLTVALELFATIPPSSNDTPATRINFLDDANDGSGRLFVNDLRDNLYVIENDSVSVYLDVAGRFSDFVDEPRLGTGFGFFTFHPQFASNGKFYTVHTEAGNGLPAADYTSIFDENVQGVVTEWTAVDPDASTFSGTQRELIRIGFSEYVHGIQQIGFNPTAQPGDSDYGLLYLAAGDGESNPTFSDTPQNLTVPQGKILRLDPLGTNAPNGQYGIPASNPFVATANALGEIWAYGLRNPHRFSWDMGGSKKMFIGSIGERYIESIYPGIAGANYGWNVREGGFLFDTDNPDFVYELPQNDTNAYTYPVAQYDHDEGFAVVGGFVYRGAVVPDLTGMYVFGDIVNGRIFYTDQSAMVAGQPAAPIQELTLVDANGDAQTMRDFVGAQRVDLRFGVDAENELYVLAKSTGEIWRVQADEAVVQPIITPVATSTLMPGAASCDEHTVSIVAAVTESSFNDDNSGTNVIDDDLGTRWSGQGDGEWVQLALDDSYTLTGILLAFYQGDERTADFEIEVSADGSNWTPVLSGTSNGASLQLQQFIFSAADVSFVRFVGYGNSVNDWNSVTEIALCVVDTTANPLSVGLESAVTNPSLPLLAIMVSAITIILLALSRHRDMRHVPTK